MTAMTLCDLPYMEYCNVIDHSEQIFELSLEMTLPKLCDLPYMEYSDVIYYSDQILSSV